MPVTIYHNPNCGTSRNVLAMIRESREEPVVIEYLKNPPSRERLKQLVTAMGMPVRALLREKGTPYAQLGLANPKWSDEQLLDFMIAHPILINRPIVVTPEGVRLRRPSETVLGILPHANIGRFVKEDGEVVEAGPQSRPKPKAKIPGAGEGTSAGARRTASPSSLSREEGRVRRTDSSLPEKNFGLLYENQNPRYNIFCGQNRTRHRGRSR